MSDFTDMDRRFPWSFIGVILALLFGFVGVYFATHRPTPHLAATIVNEANVLDVHRPLKELLVQFRGEDIQQKKLNLRIYSIKMENDGSTDILQNHYDHETTWGLRFTNARIVEQPRLVDSNSEYLKEKLVPSLVGDNTVALPKVIFERGKFFLLEILVIHDAGVKPALKLLGKVAGIEEIPIQTQEPQKEQLSFWAEFLYGGVLAHILRIIIYPLVVLGLGWAGYQAATSLTEYVKDRNASRRLRPIEPFLADLGPEVHRPIYHAVRYGLRPKDFAVARDILSEARHPIDPSGMSWKTASGSRRNSTGTDHALSGS